jgi:hypothetical protein
MSTSLRRFGLAALAALSLVSAEARAQAFLGPGGRRVPTVGLQSAANLTSINPRWFVAPGLTLNQYAANVATLGSAFTTIPPYLLGFNPFPPVLNTGAGFSTISPLTSVVSTGFNPYLPGGGTGALAANPYGSGSTLSTVPGGGSGASGGYSNPYYPTYYPNPTESAFKGAADYLRGEADYYKGVQQAKLTREKARQAAVETRRRLLQEDIDFERMRPKAPDLRAFEDEGDRRMAERARPGPEVWSGRALNSLLRSVADKGGLGRGPNIPLGEDTLKGLNLTDGSSRGNPGLLKDTDKLGDISTWPAALQERQYDEQRKRLVRNLRLAAAALKDRETPDRATLKDLRAGYRALSEGLEASVRELSPSQYIEARRFLNQVRDATRALADPKVTSRAPTGQTVAELVDYMRSNGLEFAPATAGDERAYNALYNALRSFERSLASR